MRTKLVNLAMDAMNQVGDTKETMNNDKTLILMPAVVGRIFAEVVTDSLNKSTIKGLKT